MTERTPIQHLGDSMADKIVETLDGFPGTDADRAEAAGIVVARLTDYQVQKEDSDAQ